MLTHGNIVADVAGVYSMGILTSDVSCLQSKKLGLRYAYGFTPKRNNE